MVFAWEYKEGLKVQAPWERFQTPSMELWLERVLEDRKTVPWLTLQCALPGCSSDTVQSRAGYILFLSPRLSICYLNGLNQVAS